jgi:alpha-ketoglutaric semialdehyde dehydrogenase
MTEREALVLVDLQHDFLRRPSLSPPASALVSRAASLLADARSRGLPIAHVHTVVRAAGTDRMPHWIANGVNACIAGSPGAATPDPLTPTAGELVVEKQFFSAFGGSPSLGDWLRAHGVERLMVAGVMLHGCVRATVLDAYERGFAVAVAADAVGDDDAVHAAASRAWLDGRAATFTELATAGTQMPVPTVSRARQVAWAGRAVDERAAVLERWAEVLDERAGELTELVVEEIGKPRRAAADETRRATAHVRTAAAIVRSTPAERALGPRVAVRQRPVGVVGLILPWNNPIAITAGKIAPALGFGNGVVLKPAPEAQRSTAALLGTLDAAGVPAGLVAVVAGGPGAALALCDDPGVDAVSITGSVAAGRAVAARCVALGKPVQGELGGNNAAIVLADADLDTVVPGLVHAAYDFAGQRCTAIRRFVVEAAIAERFVALAHDAMKRLVVGDPGDERTDIGPLISLAARRRVLAVIDEARAEGATIFGGEVLEGEQAWLSPCLITGAAASSAVAQEETFGPVAVVLPVRGLAEAITVANGVPHGLVLAACTDDAVAQARIRHEGRAGIVQIGAGPLPVDAAAPFGGWGVSGIGPPEHGEWDAAFYTRPQAVYS